MTLRPPDGVAYLAFHLNEHHVRPVWPSTPDQPQQQLHLDFEVDDLDRRRRHAIELGRRWRSSSRRTTYGCCSIRTGIRSASTPEAFGTVRTLAR